MRTLFVFFIFACTCSTFTSAFARDPFASVLPRVQKKVDLSTGDAYDQAMAQAQGAGQVVPLSFVLQGVFWDTENPRAIIDGEVYKVQDIIKGTDNARVVQIKKNSIVVLYNGNMIVKKPELKI